MKMKKQLSDEQIDALMRTLIEHSQADQSLLREIADSPSTWWGLQRRINEQKAETRSPWPPVGRALRWLMVGIPSVAAAALAISLFVLRPATIVDTRPIAVNTAPITTLEPAPNALTSPAKSNIFPDQPVVNPTKQGKRNIVAARAVRTDRPVVHKAAEIAATAPVKEEIKTDFIALSYARDPDSGQIVRVKVPRALMVSLGVVASDKTPSGMVDAEVLVGDDGLTRAIRFIR